MKRQAATPNGLQRRLRDLQLDKVHDPRRQANLDYPLPTLLCGLIAAMVSGASALRHVEQRTGQMAKKLGGWMGLVKRVADNTFSTLLARLFVTDLLGRLHSLVKAEQRRGNLKPKVLPVGTVAIDGKNVATLRWHDLCRVLELDQIAASVDNVRELLTQRFPQVQLCVPKEGKPYALARVHTVTLISSSAAQCVHQRPIPGCTNEIGAMPELLEELHRAYQHSSLVAMVTTDAGNTSLAVAGKIVGYGWDYFCQIKSELGEIYREASRALKNKRAHQADANVSEHRDGKNVTYRLWCYDLEGEGWLDWTSARQLVRVQRTVVDRATGNEESIGNRYYVASKTPTELGPQSCLTISRRHWRCENETHWSADVALAEDQRRLSMSRHPNGVFVVGVLRMIALNILAIARKLSRIGTSEQTPSWKQVVEHFFLVLCESILETEAFDAVI
jgi:predicted transposase YbfD/YdcC